MSVRWSVGPSVTFLNSEGFLHYCSRPTVRDWIAVHPASLFIPLRSLLEARSPTTTGHASRLLFGGVAGFVRIVLDCMSKAALLSSFSLFWARK